MTDIIANSDRADHNVEDLSRRVLDSLTAEIAVLDRDGTIVAVNKAWSQFAADNGGTKEKTGMGVNYLDVCRAAAGDDELAGKQVCRGIQRVLDGSEDVFKFEYPCHSEEHQRWFLLHVSRLEAADSFIVTTHLPITERKLTEQRLVVAERLAAIGEAMKGLSHEGRNALQRAQAHMALLRFHVSENPEAMELLQKIEVAQDHMLGLYEEVKNYAAPIHLQRQRCELNKLIEQVWHGIEPTVGSAQFSLTSQSSNPCCEVDINAIGIVVRGVFQNALAAASGHARIDVTLFDDDLAGQPAVTIVVSDNGTGVPTTDRENVFQPFHTTRTKGTGLGLAFARRIVLQHGGRIYFGTPRLSGASIYISLPRKTNGNGILR